MMNYPVKNWTAWYDAQPYGSKTDYGYHEGGDLNLKTGGDSDFRQPVYAIADGDVSSVEILSKIPSFGKHLHIKHIGAWGTVWSHCAHLDEIVVKEGQKVKEGDLVGYVGKSGTTLCHLHFAIKLAPTGINGIAKTLTDLKKWADPIKLIEKYKTQPVTPPVKEDPSIQLERTQKERDEARVQLEEEKKRSEAIDHDLHLALEKNNQLDSDLTSEKAATQLAKDNLAKFVDRCADMVGSPHDEESVVKFLSNYGKVFDDLNEYKDKYDREVIAHKATHDTYQRKTDDIAKQLDDMEKRHGADKIALQEKHQTEIDQLKGQIDRLQQEIAINTKKTESYRMVGDFFKAIGGLFKR
jgi:septal ring factor EnvC (AmiA/AmiB activator)